MSRIGRLPIEIPSKVTVNIQPESRQITVVGPKGTLTHRFPFEVLDIAVEGTHVKIDRKADTKMHRAFHGLHRALIQNMVKGVTAGFKKELEIIGVGYRGEVKGKALRLELGYSHPIDFVPPENIKIETPERTRILIEGIDKALVGEVAAKIRSFRPPEPYKGKGIRYVGEYVRRKVGKALTQ